MKTFVQSLAAIALILYILNVSGERALLSTDAEKIGTIEGRPLYKFNDLTNHKVLYIYNGNITTINN